jgi:hypothetical protein
MGRRFDDRPKLALGRVTKISSGPASRSPRQVVGGGYTGEHLRYDLLQRHLVDVRPETVAKGLLAIVMGGFLEGHAGRCICLLAALDSTK